MLKFIWCIVCCLLPCLLFAQQIRVEARTVEVYVSVKDSNPYIRGGFEHPPMALANAPRARQGMVLFVPPGDTHDPTRLPSFYDLTFNCLREARVPALA